jgi:threonine/homoserine/homoserine lactone efflux protein
MICCSNCIGSVLLQTIKSLLMNWQEFTALLVLATAMSFTPGPNTTLSTALAANHGLRHAMPFVCAVPVGWGVLLGICALGLGALVLAMPLLGWAIKLAGVAYLLWLASKIARSRQLSQADAARLNVTFWQGAALQFVNIKAWMLALAIVSGWVAGRADPGQRMAVVLPVMLAFAFASNLTYALAGSLLREWLAGPRDSGRRLVVFNRAMAAVLVVTALWMLFL